MHARSAEIFGIDKAYIHKNEKCMNMSNAKMENLLNLALDASRMEREKSINLGVGYSPEAQTWEVIVR